MFLGSGSLDQFVLHAREPTSCKYEPALLCVVRGSSGNVNERAILTKPGSSSLEMDTASRVGSTLDSTLNMRDLLPVPRATKAHWLICQVWATLTILRDLVAV